MPITEGFASLHTFAYPRVVQMGMPEGEDIDISMLEHVSPIEWENVILYGQYVLDPNRIR